MIFLRPWFLLALLIPFFIKGLGHLKKAETPWTKFIDKKLLSSLLIKESKKNLQKFISWKMLLLWGIWCFALSGPALYKLPTPAVESASNTIIVFDLNMQGKELLQGQAKLYDLLTELRGERIGLVVFGENQGYTAMPLTPDTKLLKEIVPTLTPKVLPVGATNPTVGFQYASKLLDQAGHKGRILYVSNKPQKWEGNYSFGNLDLTNRTADNTDIKSLLQNTKKAKATYTEGIFSTEADVWADLGGWIVLFSLPLFALMFRKGLLFIVLFFISTNLQAGFLWRPDQNLYQINKKGISAYQKKDFKMAEKFFHQSENFYNLGNTLAFSGDIQGAIEAYKKELENHPDNQDAQFNKEYLEEQLPPPEDQAQQNEEGESEENKNNSDENSNQDQNKNNQDKSDQENKSEEKNPTSQNKDQESSDQKQENQPTQDETQAELEKALADYNQESHYNQEEQQIINRLNHDPSRVLRYRLMLQHQKGNSK